MEVHPYLQQKAFNEWLRSKGIHVVQFSPLGNMNDFYRQTGWAKEISHMMKVVDQQLLKDISKKVWKEPGPGCACLGNQQRPLCHSQECCRLAD